MQIEIESEVSLMSEKHLNQIDPDIKELSELEKLGLRFKNQQVGKRPEAFNRYVSDIVKKMGKPTFKNLMYELELAAVHRKEHGEKASPIEKVDRTWELITFHDPKRGRTQKTFKTVRNHLTKAKKISIPVCAK